MNVLSSYPAEHPCTLWEEAQISMPRKRSLRTSKGKSLAACLLTTWLTHQIETRDVLVDLLRGEGLEVTLPEIEGNAQNGACSMSPMNPHSLISRNYLVDDVLNKFLKLIASPHIRLLLISKNPVELLAWTKHSSLIDERTDSVIVRLHDISTRHWALAVVRRRTATIGIIDALPAVRTFFTIFPRLVQWANMFAKIYGSSWSDRHRIVERTDVAITGFEATDSFVFMCFHAYVVAKKETQDAVLVPQDGSRALRQLMFTSIVSGEVCDFTARNTPQLQGHISRVFDEKQLEAKVDASVAGQQFCNEVGQDNSGYFKVVEQNDVDFVTNNEAANGRHSRMECFECSVLEDRIIACDDVELPGIATEKFAIQESGSRNASLLPCLVNPSAKSSSLAV